MHRHLLLLTPSVAMAVFLAVLVLFAQGGGHVLGASEDEGEFIFFAGEEDDDDVDEDSFNIGDDDESMDAENLVLVENRDVRLLFLFCLSFGA